MSIKSSYIPLKRSKRCSAGDRLMLSVREMEGGYWPHRGGSQQRREPQKNFFSNFKEVSWSRNMCFSYRCAPYFACAKLYTFPVVSACAPDP